MNPEQIKEEISKLEQSRDAFMRSYWKHRRNIEEQCNHEDNQWEFHDIAGTAHTYFRNTCSVCGYTYDVDDGDIGYHDLYVRWCEGEFE